MSRTDHRAGLPNGAFALSLGAVFVLVACAGPVQGARPEDMSHAEHERLALEHEDESLRMDAQVDPSARPALSARYSSRAEQHRRHAEAHRAAAVALERRHEGACEGVSRKDMVACPFALHSTVLEVEEVEHGVRLALASDAEQTGADVLAHARCHAAHGAYVGRVDMAGCPFYVRGLQVALRRVDGEELLVLTTSDPEALSELRRRVGTLVP